MLMCVGYYLIDGLQNAHRRASRLRTGAVGQPLRRQHGNDGSRLSNSSYKHLRQRGSADTTVGAELSLAYPNIFDSANAMHDPLPYISAKMQDDISHGVLMCSTATPNLLIRQLAQAS